jgi:uncharacterized cupredoxin-like copper-binding protein
VQATQPPTGGEGTTVEITLADNTIASPLASFQAGIPYTFVIENTGPHAHDFNINPPAEQTGGLDAARDQALLAVEQSELSPGATVTVTYTFPASAIGATLELSCLIRNHYLDGMRLPITVTP